MRIQDKKVKVVYDYDTDTLSALQIDRKYEISQQIGNLVIDIDKDNKIMGFEILDASEIFSIPKIQ